MNFEYLEKLKELYIKMGDIISKIDNDESDYIKAEDYFKDKYLEFREWAIRNNYLFVDFNPYVSDRLITKSNCKEIYIKSDNNENRFFMVHKDIIEKYEQNNKGVLY